MEMRWQWLLIVQLGSNYQQNFPSECQSHHGQHDSLHDAHAHFTTIHHCCQMTCSLFSKVFFNSCCCKDGQAAACHLASCHPSTSCWCQSSVTCPSKKKAKNASTKPPLSSTMATTSVPHLPFVPKFKSDCIEPSLVRSEEQQHECQKDGKVLEDLFDKISNYSVFDFLPFASFGRQ